MALSVVILAAGQGKRMHSSLPKPLHELAGKPMLLRVLQVVDELGVDETFVVYSGEKALFEQVSSGYDVSFILQDRQLGTGHAVHQVLSHINPGNQVLVLFADVPLIGLSLLQDLMAKSRHDSVGVITTQLEEATGFGRIVRDQNRQIVSIVEHKDASDLELEIQEINTGIMRIPEPYLSKWLPKLTNENAQGEYYLTDIVAYAVGESVLVEGVEAEDAQAVLGVNNRAQLAQMERYYQRCQIDRLLQAGVTILDPLRFDCRGDLIAGQDVVMDVGVILRGRNVIGSGCRIGPYVVLDNVQLGDNVEIEAFSVLQGAVVEDDVVVGPFARLRPGAELQVGSKVGNFVEIKNTRLGEGAKASHLAYLGDAEIGAGANIGAGTITCNYDGVNKHQTVIEQGAFIGSNSALVAPVRVGERAVVAAGSTITEDVPADKLTIARSRQQTIEDWQLSSPVQQPAIVED